MNTKTTNRDEILLYALIIGIFIFVFTALNTHHDDGSHYLKNQGSIVTELSFIERDATLNFAPEVPVFNPFWITSDLNKIKLNPNQKFSVVIINNKYSAQQRFCTENYLKIKPICFKVLISSEYSTNEYSEAPSVA